MRISSYGIDGLRQRHPQLSHHLIYNKEKCSEETNGLKRIRPNQRLDTTTTRIEPNQCYHSEDGNGKGNTPSLKHKPLQDHADHIKAHHSARHLRKQKERGARLISPRAQSLPQIRINSRQVQLIIKGQQQESHQKITQDKAQARLHIGHVDAGHHTRYTDERHPRDTCPHHAKSHHIPRRLSVGTKECFVGCMSARQSANGEQNCKINQYCCNNPHIRLQSYRFFLNYHLSFIIYQLIVLPLQTDITNPK